MLFHCKFGEMDIGDQACLEPVYREVCDNDAYGFDGLSQWLPVKLAVDLGASFGPATRMIRHYWPSAKVFAIEADRSRYELLALNCPEAECRYKAVVGYMGQRKALDYVGWGEPWRPTAELIFGPPGGGPIGGPVVIDGERIRVIDGDGVFCSVAEELGRLPPIDLLKIDIEGFEWGVLKEMIEVGQIPKMIVGEWHFLNTLAGLKNLLEPLYECQWDMPPPNDGPWCGFRAKRRGD